MSEPARQPRSRLFWVLVAAGVAVSSCCLLTGAVMMLGAFAGEAEPATAAGSQGTSVGAATAESTYFAINDTISRGTTMSRPLPGGTWVAQNGAIVDYVVGRSGNFAWVNTSSSGSINELTFDDDGTYVWDWASSVALNGNRSQGHAIERGSWVLSGTQLTLTPESQKALYSLMGLKEEKTDEDLGVRQYAAVDLTLQTPDKRQLQAVWLRGPRAKWDTGSGELSLELQRLTEE